MKAFIKLALVVLLLLCLAGFDGSLGFALRLAVVAAFAFLAYDYFAANSNIKGTIFAALAVLFQPFYPVNLNHTLWSVICIVAALGVFSLLVNGLGKKR